MFTSSPADKCFNTGVVKAIEYFVKQRIGAINGEAAFADRQLRVDFYNDDSDPQKAVANVRKAMDNPTTLAMVGLSGSNRSKAVFDALGDDLSKRNIPFITDLSVTTLFQSYGNVFTMRPSQESERIPVIGRFIKDGGYARPAYVGITDNVASAELVKGLATAAQGTPVSVQELPVKDDKIDEMALKATIETLKSADTDVIIGMLGATSIEQFLAEATAAGLRVPMLLLSDSDKILRGPAVKAYAADLYQLAWQTLPDVYNTRLRQQMIDRPGDRWLFADTVNRAAEGWKSGQCKMPEADPSESQLDPANLRAIARATRFADMVGLIGEILKGTPQSASLIAMRARIADSIKADYAVGHGTYRGAYDNWSFHPLRRTASQSPYILRKQRGSETVRLAPRQYAKLRDDALREIKTIYMDIDLTRVFRVDDNEKSFFAEFFLTLNGNNPGFSVANLEFANAFLDADNGGQKITVTELHGGGPSGVYPEGVQIYKVTGKFMFHPDFSRYPFDTQLFSIELKPKSGEDAFLIQPPPASLRDTVVDTDGWSVQDQYVGYDEDYIPVTDARNDEKSIVPFYKVNFSWVMEREATDYYLRVVVPLAFILFVAFLSVFIPREHFEAIVTIQVTALLSAVALYLSIPKVGNDAATVSDRIFLIDYMAVSMMIAISIARVSPLLRRWPLADRVLKAAYMLGVPVLVLTIAYYLADMRWKQQALSWHGNQDVEQSVRDPGDTNKAKL